MGQQPIPPINGCKQKLPKVIDVDRGSKGDEGEGAHRNNHNVVYNSTGEVERAREYIFMAQLVGPQS